MLTGAQVRAARTGLRQTVQDLARSAGVSVSTVKRIEACDGVPAASARNLASIKGALEAAGIEFVGTPDDGIVAVRRGRREGSRAPTMKRGEGEQAREFCRRGWGAEVGFFETTT